MKLEFQVMRAGFIILLMVAALFMLPVWPYSAGWGYYFTGFAILLLLAVGVPPLFRRKNGEEEPKISRTKAYPEFLDEAGVSSVPKGSK